jgi:hypothetical protein
MCYTFHYNFFSGPLIFFPHTLVLVLWSKLMARNTLFILL